MQGIFREPAPTKLIPLIILPPYFPDVLALCPPERSCSRLSTGFFLAPSTPNKNLIPNCVLIEAIIFERVWRVVSLALLLIARAHTPGENEGILAFVQRWEKRGKVTEKLRNYIVEVQWENSREIVTCILDEKLSRTLLYFRMTSFKNYSRTSDELSRVDESEQCISIATLYRAAQKFNFSRLYFFTYPLGRRTRIDLVARLGYFESDKRGIILSQDWEKRSLRASFVDLQHWTFPSGINESQGKPFPFTSQRVFAHIPSDFR